MIHKFVANDNKGNVNILEVTSTGTKLGKVAPPVEDTDAATKKYVDDNAGGSLPPVTSEDNGKVLTVENGAWAAGYQQRSAVWTGPDQNHDGLQVIPIEFDGSSFSCSITPEDIEKGYSLEYYDGDGNTAYCQFPPYQESTTTIGLVYPSGDEWYEGARIPLISYDTNADGSEFQTPIIPLLFPGMEEKLGVLELASTGYNSGYSVVLASWQKEPSKFIVTLTPTALDYSGTMDKTVAEINAAYEAGQEIVFRLMVSSGVYYDFATIVTYIGAHPYPEHFCMGAVDDNLIIFSSDTDLPENTQYHTTVYALTPAS